LNLSHTASRIARSGRSSFKDESMNRIVYIVGAVVIIIALLSFFGLR
jgi:predicted membrane channel-forming protein YqfA (hemolysin III family)